MSSRISTANGREECEHAQRRGGSRLLPSSRPATYKAAPPPDALGVPRIRFLFACIRVTFAVGIPELIPTGPLVSGSYRRFRVVVSNGHFRRN